MGPLQLTKAGMDAWFERKGKRAGAAKAVDSGMGFFSRRNMPRGTTCNNCFTVCEKI